MFEPRNLSVLAYANGFTLWHYKALHISAPTRLGCYFDPASEMLAVGDMILISAPVGGKIVIVTSSRQDGVIVQALG